MGRRKHKSLATINEAWAVEGNPAGVAPVGPMLHACDSCMDVNIALHPVVAKVEGLRSGTYKGDVVPLFLCERCAVAIALALLEVTCR